MLNGEIFIKKVCLGPVYPVIILNNLELQKCFIDM